MVQDVPPPISDRTWRDARGIKSPGLKVRAKYIFGKGWNAAVEEGQTESRLRAVAAAEAAIGLAILVIYFRNRGSIAVEDLNVMKG